MTCCAWLAFLTVVQMNSEGEQLRELIVKLLKKLKDLSSGSRI